jgi:putative transposase
MIDKPNRRSIRLKEYDYMSAGWYYVTICTHNRECLFGDVNHGKMVLNAFGKLVESTWYDLPNHNTNVNLDQFIVMPNHVHGIIILNDVHDTVGAGSVIVGAGSEPAPTGHNNITNPQINNKPKPHDLPEIVRQFKTFSARRINQKRQMTGYPVWQRGYFEHIIRNEPELYEIRKYIINNPAQWELDNERPDNCDSASR